MDSRTRTQIKFPPKLKGLFRPYRYKILYGGRGSAKSWSVARALLVLGAGKKLRILCTREVQKSIKDSVHKLLSDQIEKMGLGPFYEILETTIKGKNGTEFLFAGLSSQTAESIKSFEGVDIVWCEEAQTISKKSWDVLIPTIRKEDSEIWITFNPVLDTDETYVRFVINPPPNALVVFINYHDNPWFPKVLEDERVHCKATATTEDYNNIWEGMCRSAVSGAIYAQEISAAFTEGRVCPLPYDPAFKVHTIWDLGFGDNMVVIFVQRSRSEIRVIDYIQERQKRTDEVCAMVMARRYNWGYDFLPHDGQHHERKTGMSDEEILRRFGRKVKITPNIPREDGIRVTRNNLYRFYFDKDKTSTLLECLKRYRRAETKNGGDGSPVHDEYSDGADATRYTAINIDRFINEDDYATPSFETFTAINGSMGY